MDGVALGWVERREKRADIQKSITEMSKGLEMKTKQAYSSMFNRMVLLK